MNAFPEFLALDGTYKLYSTFRHSVYVFLDEDGNCQSEIVGVGLLVQEDKESFEWLISCFKNKVDSWMDIKCVMTDKDLT